MVIIAMVDNDEAEKAALRQVFPEIIIFICDFHMMRDVRDRFRYEQTTPVKGSTATKKTIDNYFNSVSL